jgi:hypothetical protein
LTFTAANAWGEKNEIVNFLILYIDLNNITEEIKDGGVIIINKNQNS